MKINLDKNEFYFDFQSWNQFHQYKLGIALIPSMIPNNRDKNKMMFNIKHPLVNSQVYLSEKGTRPKKEKIVVSLPFISLLSFDFPMEKERQPKRGKENSNTQQISLHFNNNSFFFASYRFLLYFRINIYSEKLWFNNFIQKQQMFDFVTMNQTFFERLKNIRKRNDNCYQPFLSHSIKWDHSNIQDTIFSSLISFSLSYGRQRQNEHEKIKQKKRMWSLLEMFVTHVSQHLFFDKMHYLNIDFHCLLLNGYSSFCVQFYCFFLLKKVRSLQMQSFNVKKPFFYNFIPFFKEKQLFKKILLQSLLTASTENHLSLTNEIPISGRNIYDHIENLYVLLKNHTKWIFRIDFSSNDAVFFHFPVFKWISLEKYQIFRSFSETFHFSLFKKIATYRHFKNQIFFLLNPFLWKRFEKHLIYNHYRLYKTNHFKIQNQLIIFNHSILYVSDDAYMHMESFILFKKWFLNYGFKWKNPKFFHSCFLFLNQKPGFDFYGFYLTQNTIDTSFCSKNPKKFILANVKENRFVQTHILPSKFYLLQYLNLLKKMIKQSATCSQEILIQKLTTFIERWSFYYRVITTKKVFYFCDFILFKWIWKWACRRHPNKSRNWIKQKYFSSKNRYKRNKWCFCIYNSFSKKWLCLPEHEKIKLIRHIKIRRYLTFYNENWKYWLKRFPTSFNER